MDSEEIEFSTSDAEHSLRISLDAEVPEDNSPGAWTFSRRRRNRHGRGQRGPLIPASLPGARTRSEQFEDLVVDSAERLRGLWPDALKTVEYLVEEIPDKLEALVESHTPAPLGDYTPAESALIPPVIAIYRHPVEALCDTPGQLRELIHEVLIEQVARLMDVDPDSVDPLFPHHRH